MPRLAKSRNAIFVASAIRDIFLGGYVLFVMVSYVVINCVGRVVMGYKKNMVQGHRLVGIQTQFLSPV